MNNRLEDINQSLTTAFAPYVYESPSELRLMTGLLAHSLEDQKPHLYRSFK